MAPVLRGIESLRSHECDAWGGEPFCRKDLPELIEGIVRNRMRFNILSNGTLITDEMAAFWLQPVAVMGCRSPSMAQCQRPMMPAGAKGNFLKAMQGIKSLQNHNVPVSVRVTIHKENVRDLGKRCPASFGRGWSSQLSPPMLPPIWGFAGRMPNRSSLLRKNVHWPWQPF